ncbi:MAG TPA: DNA-3-methyladenine glycosylase [Longimicrobium sp.]|uniref:DNA-3-methyladenine glycosylase n=1 Tax=Longimicrobium sp. TaxID=2029185 RepID=UPI002ED99D25
MSPDPRASAASGPVRARRSPHVEPAPLPASFCDRPAEIVARELLGALLVSEVGGERCVCEIVETEAYIGPEDEASHAAARFGRTARNDAMFGPAGTAYVYLIYGVHWCLNVVTGAEGFGAAVLLRAARPVEGIEAMRARRPGRPDRDLLRGPGNLARALGVDAALNRHPMDAPPLWIAPGRTVPDAEVAVGPRIGITRAADWPLRFWVAGDPHVSKTR